jgi:serine/threonine protein kinase
MSFNIGENVGPYRIIEQLGQGGMATVYKAYHASLDRYVALKVLHPAFHQDQTFTMRFQREARVVARLEHQNIVPVYDYAEHEGRPYLVMKYIEGDTLKARMSKGPLTSEEIEQVVNSVGYALAYAHRQGILHRDIKPSNVMIATDGTMYLADFGLARIAEAGESTMSSDSIMGTPQYISPEQAMGKKDLDAGTDIYSFGVMLYEMVVGRVPFTADTPFSIIHDHIYTPLPLPMTVNANVPESVQRVLLKALAKDRVDRYATTEELIKAFKDAWTEAGVPMQGTAIIMRTATVKNEKQQAAASQSSAPAAEDKKDANTPAPKKKLSPWMWVGIGALVLLCLLAASIAIRNNRGRQGQNANNAPPATAFPSPVIMPTQVAPPTQAMPATPPPLPGGQLPGGQQPGGSGGPVGGVPQPNPNDSPEVIAAKEAVGKNPNDPNAHLQLSFAFLDMKETRPAMDELRMAMDLADPADTEFFLNAAKEYKKRDAWGSAASVYIRVIPAYRSSGGMPADVQQDVREAIYKATEQVTTPLEPRFFERLDNFNTPFAHVVRGRYALYTGNLAEANNEIKQSQKLQPDMPEVALLQAEIAVKEGNNKKARELLTALSANTATPAWVRLMAENYLKTLK